jgi:hypothetical protein
MAIDNSSIFSAKVVPQSTQTEMEGRTSPYYQYGMSGRKVWAHMISMCENNPYEIRMDANPKYSTMYTDSRPKTLLQSIDIKAQGEYGSLRRGTVNLMVFSDDELNKVANAYFIPNMSVRLQWGWSVDCFGQNGPEPITEMGLPDSVAMQKIIDRVGAYACLDGFQGRVRGWDFSLTSEGVWDVKLDLIAASAAVSEVRVSDKTEDCKCEQQSTSTNAEGGEETESKTEVTGRLEAALIDLIDDENFIGEVQATFGGGRKYEAFRISYPGYSRDETGKEDSGTTLLIEADLDAEEVYLTWRTIEALLTHGVAQQECGGSPCLFKIDSGDVTLKVPNQKNGGRWFSADPRVCILPGGGLDFEEPVEGTDVLAAQALGAISFGVGAVLYMNSATNDYYRPITNAFVDNNTIKLGDIYVSSIHFLKRVREISKGDSGTVMQVLNGLLSDINQACGGVWDFEIHETTIESGETKTPVVMSVVDANSIVRSDSEGVFTFFATANKSNCRDIKLDLKLTDAMMTQATYGTNNQEGNTPSDNVPCNNRFLQYSKNAVNTAAPKESPKQMDSTCKDTNKCGPSKEVEPPQDVIRKKVTTETVNGAVTYLQEQKAAYLKDKGLVDKSAYCRSSMVPFEFSATVTGVGGFRFGQLVTCDRIPEEMRKAFNFQVTTVEHSIKPEDWTTTINTIGKNKPS